MFAGDRIVFCIICLREHYKILSSTCFFFVMERFSLQILKKWSYLCSFKEYTQTVQFTEFSREVKEFQFFFVYLIEEYNERDGKKDLNLLFGLVHSINENVFMELNPTNNHRYGYRSKGDISVTERHYF